MVTKITTPASNTPALSGLLVATVYYNFFDALTKRLNDLTASQITATSTTAIPESVKQQEVFFYTPLAAMNIDLPAADKVKGVIFHIANKSAPNIFNITIMGAGTINGLPSLTVAPGQSRALVSVGNEWITV